MIDVAITAIGLSGTVSLPCLVHMQIQSPLENILFRKMHKGRGFFAKIKLVKMLGDIPA